MTPFELVHLRFLLVLEVVMVDLVRLNVQAAIDLLKCMLVMSLWVCTSGVEVHTTTNAYKHYASSYYRNLESISLKVLTAFVGRHLRFLHSTSMRCCTRRVTNHAEEDPAQSSW
jgi:hypothetical protein